MWPKPTETLPSLDHPRPAPPPRSILFALKPRGVRTDQVEALSSYVTRLARAHSVSPRWLIREELRRRAPNPEESRWLGHTSRQMSMDGLGKFSQLLVPLLEELTTVPSLEYLTLLPLADLIPRNGPYQLHPHPRWCPNCYLEQIHAGEDISRPLLWSLALYRICHRHLKIMLEACPKCGGHQRFIPVLPDLIHCGQCGEALTMAPPERSRVTVMDLWKSRALADLLSRQGEATPREARESLVAFLGKVHQFKADDKPYPFGHRIRFILSSTKKSIAAGNTLSLARLLEVGYYANTFPSVMLIDGDKALLNPGKFRKDRVAIRVPHSMLGLAERQHLELDLNRIVDDPADVRSMEAIATALGHGRTCLKRWFPEQCRVIVLKAAYGRRMQIDAKHLEDQKRLIQIVKAAFASPVPLKHRQIVELLNTNGLYLVRRDLESAFRMYVEEGLEPGSFPDPSRLDN